MAHKDSKKVYLGGSKDFDEVTGKYKTSIPRAGTRLSPGVYRDAKGGLVGSHGRRLPSQGPSGLPNPGAALGALSPDDGIDRTTRAERQGRIDQINRDGIQNLMGHILPDGRTVGQLEYEKYMLDQPEMGQASANRGGKYRLSPGVYGTQQQAENQARQSQGAWRDSRRPATDPAAAAAQQPPFDMDALLAMIQELQGLGR